MKKIDIIYEDDDIIVINKDANILSIPDRYQTNKFNLKSYLESEYQDIFVIHRLDKDTSGIICFAKNEIAHRELSMQFQERSVKKVYHLFCEGHPLAESGEIDEPILKRTDGKGIIHKKGKPSRSLFKVIKKFRFHSLLEFELLTGRTHQARIHAAHIGCPLMVDPMYGNKEYFYLSEVKRKYRTGKYKEEQPLLRRTPLHARFLECKHPTSGEIIQFDAEYPKDLRALEKQLTKWSSV